MEDEDEYTEIQGDSKERPVDEEDRSKFRSLEPASSNRRKSLTAKSSHTQQQTQPKKRTIDHSDEPIYTMQSAAIPQLSLGEG